MKIQGQFPEGAFLTLEQGERKTEVLSELICAEIGPPGLTIVRRVFRKSNHSTQNGEETLGPFLPQGQSRVSNSGLAGTFQRRFLKTQLKISKVQPKVFTIPKHPFTVAIS